MPVIEVRPGEGGEDAAVFAGEIIDAIAAALRRHHVACELVTDASRTGRITAPTVPRPILVLAGTHRIQRIPTNDRRGRRHTSTATVVILNDTHQATVTAGEDELEVEWFSGQGAGGQHRNKSSNCVRLRHIPTGIEVVGTRQRSRRQNLADARSELARRLTDAAALAAAADRNNVRRAQAVPDRAAKSWTWNAQRDEVVDHATGRTVRMRDMLRGKLPA